MSSAAGGLASAGARMGINPGALILEIGAGPDSDQALREEISNLSGNPFLSEETEDVVDIALVWFRDDGDDDPVNRIVDLLVDSMTFLVDGGAIWVLTPKVGRPGHVEPSDIQEAAPTAGLSQTSSFAAASNCALRSSLGSRAMNES